MKNGEEKLYPITLRCRDCQGSFEFSVHDQRFFREQGWGAPVRCKPCRDERRKELEARRQP